MLFYPRQTAATVTIWLSFILTTNDFSSHKSQRRRKTHVVINVGCVWARAHSLSPPRLTFPRVSL